MNRELMRALEMIPIIIIIIGLLVSIFLLRNEQKPCSASQLHEVIEKVERCSKVNVICSSEMKDEILSEVCGK